MDFLTSSTGFLVDIVTTPSISSDNIKDDATYGLIKKFMIKTGLDVVLTKENNNLLSKAVSYDEFTDIVAHNLNIDLSSKLKYLFELDITSRLSSLLEDLYKQQMFKELETKIENEVKKSISESQKEYYLREKMKAIQEELGEKAKTMKMK